MLRKIFAKSRTESAIPAGMRLYAIGDVHGCADLLNQLIAKIDEFDDQARRNVAGAEQQGPAQLVFLGDYIDRGPDTSLVLDRLIAFGEERPNTVFLKGNHEALMLDFLECPEDMGHWLDWGGEETLRSYGIDNITARPPHEIAEELRSKAPAKHIDFLRRLTLTHQVGDYFFVHAGIMPGVALDAQKEEDLLWIRRRFHKAKANERPEATIVHGHQPVKSPLDVGWRIDVDTGACWSGKLTALALIGKKKEFISATK